MILQKRIPAAFYSLFRTRNMDAYMQFLVEIYEAGNESCAPLGLTDEECRSIIQETMNRAQMVLWNEEDMEEAGNVGFGSMTPYGILDRLVKWGWLLSDYDERLNCYVISFPEYSQLYVELFKKLGQEDDSRERESILAVYSALFTYQADAEKNNSILKGAVYTSRRLSRLLTNMQDGMRAYFDELSGRKDFLGIQEVLVRELNNADSRRYAILTTTDSFYRYKEAVKELISRILDENEEQKRSILAGQRGYAVKSGLTGQALEDSAHWQRQKRAAEFCEEAAQLVYQVEREFDLIEKKYNRLIEQKTIFARRALARIHYLLQEGENEEDVTLVLINLLSQSSKKEEILKELRSRMFVTSQFKGLSDDSLYNRRGPSDHVFAPVAVDGQEETKRELADFVPKPLYTKTELAAFREKNMRAGRFEATKETVADAQDLEKLLLLWQEATERPIQEGAVCLGEELCTDAGFSFTRLTITEDRHV